MSPEKMRVAIAEACPGLFWVYRSQTESRISLQPPRARIFKLGEHPSEGDRECNLLNDLNAMADVENILTDPADACGYAEELCRAVSNRRTDGPTYAAISATALQRAEAFLRTIGKWSDD